MREKLDGVYALWSGKVCLLWQPNDSWERWKVSRKGRMKVSHLEAALSHETRGPPPVIGEEFAARQLRGIQQPAGIFVHSHPEEFQVNRDWLIFWSERNLLVECFDKDYNFAKSVRL